MLARWGRTAQRLRWLIVIVWIAAIAPTASAAFGVADQLSSGGYELPGSDSVAADQVMAREFDMASEDLVLVLRRPSAMPADAFDARVTEAHERLTAHSAVEALVAPPIASGGKAADVRATIVRLSVAADRAVEAIPTLRSELEDLGVESWFTGGPAVDADMAAASERDVQRAELLALPLALVVLVVLFGTLVSALVPLVVAGAAIAVTLAIIAGIASFTTVSVFVFNITTLLGLGLGIDYALLLTYRYREEIAKRPPAEALGVTLGTAGKAVLFSGVMVAIGFSALTIVDLPVLRSIGMGGALVVLVTVVAALTLVPAVLAILGPRLAWLPVIPPRLRAARAGWARLARLIMRHPLPVVMATAAVLVLLAVPAPRMQLDNPGVEALPGSMEAREGAQILTQAFPELTPPDVVVTVTDPDGVLRQSNAPLLQSISKRIVDEPDLRLVAAPPFAATATTALFSASSDRSLAELDTLVYDLRSLNPPEGVELHVGGEAGHRVDLLEGLYGPLPWIVAFVFGLTVLALSLAFGSFTLPINALVLNLLSLTAAFGAVVFVFQDGRLEGLLGFEATGSTDLVLPILLFCILFGLSMDYQVFMLTRIREAYVQSRDPSDSVAEGLERTGGIITGAALIMIIVAGAFVTADVLTVKATAVGIALAVLVDATVVRALLLPATMRLLGRWTWALPRWLRPLLERTAAGLGHAEPAPVKVPVER